MANAVTAMTGMALVSGVDLRILGAARPSVSGRPMMDSSRAQDGHRPRASVLTCPESGGRGRALRKMPDSKSLRFDLERRTYGGFNVLVEV